VKFLLTSDLHIKNGIFVDIALDYLEHLREYIEENNIDYLFILGDVFEKSTRIHNEAFVPIFKSLHKLSGVIPLYFILGNHDIYSTNRQDSIIETFRPFGTVISGGKYGRNFESIDTTEWLGIDFIPYTKDVNVLGLEKSKNKILMTHLAIADFKFDNNYHVKETIAFKPELFSEYKYVFTGHFHNHQSKHNIVYIGSPYQISFGEEGQKKGFVVFDSLKEDWEFVEYNSAPEHITISVEDVKKLDEIDFKNKFVKLKIKRKVDEFIKLKYILYERGAISIVLDFQVEDIEIDSTSKVDMSSSLEHIIREYIKGIADKNIDNKKLLNIFEEVVKEA